LNRGAEILVPGKWDLSCYPVRPSGTLVRRSERLMKSLPTFCSREKDSLIDDQDGCDGLHEMPRRSQRGGRLAELEYRRVETGD